MWCCSYHLLCGSRFRVNDVTQEMGKIHMHSRIRTNHFIHTEPDWDGVHAYVGNSARKTPLKIKFHRGLEFLDLIGYYALARRFVGMRAAVYCKALHMHGHRSGYNVSPTDRLTANKPEKMPWTNPSNSNFQFLFLLFLFLVSRASWNVVRSTRRMYEMSWVCVCVCVVVAAPSKMSRSHEKHTAYQLTGTGTHTNTNT